MDTAVVSGRLAFSLALPISLPMLKKPTLRTFLLCTPTNVILSALHLSSALFTCHLSSFHCHLPERVSRTPRFCYRTQYLIDELKKFQISDRQARKSVQFTDSKLVVDADGSVSMVNSPFDDSKDTAVSHTPRTASALGRLGSIC